MKQKRFSLVLLAIMMVWTVSFADNVSQFLQTKATTVLRAAHPTSTLDRGTATCTYEGYGWYKLSMHITAVWNSGYDFSISFI